ncbi:MAG: hypothetical protein JXX29_03620 [Deltaproteobacteria bacterium]|nr:hypothetical protein [Deltaproteobacteria bacterium]MBN2670732.1 hypothetical protein [Deltaproteobacteria bacterium]
MLNTRAATNANFFGVHAYGSTPPERIVGNVLTLREMLLPYFDTPPPVINTEWGFSAYGLGTDGHSDDARHRQAVLGTRALLSAWVTGMPVTTWYDMKDDCDDPNDNECNFGLLDVNNSPKPIYHAFATLRDAATQHTLNAILSNGTGPHMLRLQGTDEIIIIAWLSQPGAEISIQTPPPLAAWDMYGNSTDMGELFLLREADGPIYLRYQQQSDADTDDTASDGSSTRDSEQLPQDANNGSPDSGCGCETAAQSAAQSAAPTILLLIAFSVILLIRRFAE